MTELAIVQRTPDDDTIADEVDESFIPLSDPDITLAEIQALSLIHI